MQRDVLDVAIVGGGIAGSYAAYRLRQTNQRLALFECSNRIGGRMFTYRPMIENSEVKIDLGAMRFNETAHTKMSQLCNELGLHVIPLSTSKTMEEDTVYYVRGQHLSKTDMFHGKTPFSLTEEEKENRERILIYYLERLTGMKFEGEKTLALLLTNNLRTKDGTPLHHLSFEEALDRVVSPDGKAFVQCVHGIPANRCSNGTFHDHLNLMIAAKTSPHFLTVAEGMSTIPQSLVDTFLKSNGSHKVHLNKVLKSITKTDNGLYTLSFGHSQPAADDTFTMTQENVEYITAKSIILAIPLKSLDRIQWIPLESDHYKRLRSELIYIPIVRVFLFFDKPWWRKSAHIPLTSKSDLRYTESMDLGKIDGVYILLASSKKGGVAEYRTRQSRNSAIPGSSPGDLRVSTDLKNDLLDQLALAVQIPRQDIPEPLGGVMKSWDGDNKPGVVMMKSGCQPQTQTQTEVPSPNPDACNRTTVENTGAISSLSEENRVYVVGSDLAADRALAPWAEGALRVVDEVLHKFNLLA